MDSVNLPQTLSKNILLTGAGFTHNLGGFLANTMWSEISNRLHRHNNLQYDTLLNDYSLSYDYDYEELYQKIVYGKEYDENQKSDFIQCFKEVYEALDNELWAVTGIYKTAKYVSMV